MTDQLALPFTRTPKPRSRPSYHVRAHQTVPELQAGEAKAQKQEERVLELFKSNRNWATSSWRLTPWDVAEALGLPVTSARRALTNLTYRGLLRHYPADRRQSGPYGAMSGTWGLA
jgi:ribosomal protein S25